MLYIKGTHVMKKEKEIPLFKLQQNWFPFATNYEFVMIKFSILLDPVLRLVHRVCLTHSKKGFIKDSRILQKTQF